MGHDERPTHKHDYGALLLGTEPSTVPTGGTATGPLPRIRRGDPRPGRAAHRHLVAIRSGRTGARSGATVECPRTRAVPFSRQWATRRARNRHTGYSEHVVQLTSHLGVISANYPGLPTGDADFGATPLLFQRPGCPPELAVGNKYGSFFVYDRDRISSGPVQRIELGGSGFGQYGLLGVAAYWPATATVFVSNPLDRGRYRHGIVAFRVTASCRLSFEWSATDGPDGDNSSPTVAAGVVFFGDGYGHRAAAFDARTGRLLWDSGRAIHGSVYAGPTVVNGKVYVSSVGGYRVRVRPCATDRFPAVDFR